MKTCTICEVDKDDSAFEAVRKQCKQCRRKQRKTAAGEAGEVDRLTAPHVKACIECDAPWSVSKFKWRTDIQGGSWRPSCNACYNGKKHYAVYRQRKRDDDEASFLEHNAKMMKIWRDANPDKVKALYLKRQANVDSRWGQLVTYAKTKGKFVDIRQIDVLKKRMTEPCFYCGFDAPERHRLNGLDCVDPRKGYTAENTVPACAPCNMMKCTKSIDSFVYHARRNRSQPATGPPASVPQIMKTTTKSKLNDLARDDITRLHLSHCHYCGLFPALGIDRMDSSVHYTPENSVACCTECNYAKKDLDPEDFRRHSSHIAFHTRYWVLQPSHPQLSLAHTAEWCYHSVIGDRNFLTLRPDHPSVPKTEWSIYPATEFHRLFENHFSKCTM